MSLEGARDFLILSSDRSPAQLGVVTNESRTTALMTRMLSILNVSFSRAPTTPA